MAEHSTANVSGRSTFFSKCYMFILVAVLVCIAAAFLFFAIMRQSHPNDVPAQKTEVAHVPSALKG